MKKFAALLLLLPVLAGAQHTDGFKLKGKLQTTTPVDWVYITYRAGDDVVRDSLQAKGGRFTYKGKLAEPTLATVKLQYAQQPGTAKAKAETAPLFLEPGKITLIVKDSIDNLRVKGSAAHADYARLVATQKSYNDVLTPLYADWSRYGKEKNTAAQQKVEAQVDSIDNELKEKVFKKFAQSHPQSPVALFAVKQYAGYDIDADKVAPLFEALPASTQQWPSAIEFKEQLDIAKKTGIGKMAMDFTQADTAGNPVALSSFKGKYVLVDFWASWCGPCRAENPNVVKVFNNYKDKGFTVLGVSLDRPNAKDRWLKAIHDDNLTWTHVSDLKFWENAVAVQYGIKAIPQNLLIDPQGKIVAKNIRGEALQKAVEKAVGEKTF